MSKKEIVALMVVLLISIGVPAIIYYYEFVYRPAAFLRSLGDARIWEFVIANASSWNLPEIKVNKGDVVKLEIYSKEVMGFYVEDYVEKQPITGSAIIQFVVNKPGTFSIMLSRMEFECHCWTSSKYEEVGKIIVLEKETT